MRDDGLDVWMRRLVIPRGTRPHKKGGLSARPLGVLGPPILQFLLPFLYFLSSVFSPLMQEIARARRLLLFHHMLMPQFSRKGGPPFPILHHLMYYSFAIMGLCVCFCCWTRDSAVLLMGASKLYMYDDDDVSSHGWHGTWCMLCLVWCNVM